MPSLRILCVRSAEEEGHPAEAVSVDCDVFDARRIVNATACRIHEHTQSQDAQNRHIVSCFMEGSAVAKEERKATQKSGLLTFFTCILCFEILMRY